MTRPPDVPIPPVEPDWTLPAAVDGAPAASTAAPRGFIEQTFQKALLAALNALPGFDLQRTNASGRGLRARGARGKTGRVRGAVVGTYDLTGCARGLYLAVECKIDGRALRPSQLAWAAKMQKARATLVVARADTAHTVDANVRRWVAYIADVVAARERQRR